MADPQELSRTPPSPRSLRTIKGARLELARLYAETKRGQVEPGVAGKLAHILSILIGSARDHEFDERLSRIEAGLKRANGHDRSQGMRL
jgi:hypothetical protein